MQCKAGTHVYQRTYVLYYINVVADLNSSYLTTLTMGRSIDFYV
jgi:hypothetical protein